MAYISDMEDRNIRSGLTWFGLTAIFIFLVLIPAIQDFTRVRPWEEGAKHCNGNPFEPGDCARVIQYRDGWVQYKDLNNGHRKVLFTADFKRRYPYFFAE